MLVVLRAVLRVRLVQMALTPYLVQLHQLVGVVVVALPPVQMGKRVVLVEAKAVAYLVLVLAQQIKDMGAELLVLAAQIPTLAVAVALEQWGVLTLLGLLLALVALV